MADEIITPSANDDEYLGMEVKQLEDDEGNDFYPKTHYKAVEGIERYDDGIIGLTNDLIHLADTMIYDTGWVDYQVLPSADKNVMYAGTGFKCGIREITHYYGAETVKSYSRKMIKVNIRKFKHNEQIAQLPTGFMKNTQVFWARGGNGYQPIMVQVLNDGKIIPRLMTQDVNNADNNNWIYAQFEWTE